MLRESYEETAPAEFSLNPSVACVRACVFVPCLYRVPVGLAVGVLAVILLTTICLLALIYLRRRRYKRPHQTRRD